MQLYEMQVNKTFITRTVPVKVPKGLVGGVIRIRFSPEWESLSKTVVFRAGDVTKDILDVEEFAVIPAECTQEPDQLLEVGVYGVDAENTVAIPTMWAAIGRITEATDPSGDTTTDPILPVWAQLQERLAQLEETGVPQAKVEEAVREYFGGTVPTGSKTAQGGEIYNYYTEEIVTGDGEPFPGNTANKGAHAQNFGTHADGEYSSASGWNSTASGGIANATGRETLASGYAATTEGWSTKATGAQSHAGGKESEATGSNAFAHGIRAKATSNTSFAIGEDTEASGYYAVASGFKTKASGTCSSASGRETEAQQYASSAQGRGTIATARNQSVRGAYNIPDTVDANGNGEYAEIVGGGANTNSRANLYTLDWDGNGWFSGGVYVGDFYGKFEKLAKVNEIPKIYAWAKASTKPSYTANEVGAAPAGFGLGTNGKQVTDLNDARANGWYFCGAGTLNVPTLIPGSAYSSVFVIQRISNDITQFLITSPASTTSATCIATRSYAKGTWGEWEYINPPMMAAVEYRTTERMAGLPVYVKTFAVNANVTPGWYDQHPHGISGFKELVRCHARTATSPLPLITSTKSLCVSEITNEHIKIDASKEAFEGPISVTLWYTKN